MYFNLLLLQHQQPPDESRLNPMFFYVYCDISHFPELWVSRLLLLQLPAFNSEGEEVLAVLLLVAELYPPIYLKSWAAAEILGVPGPPHPSPSIASQSVNSPTRPPTRTPRLDLNWLLIYSMGLKSCMIFH